MAKKKANMVEQMEMPLEMGIENKAKKLNMEAGKADKKADVKIGKAFKAAGMAPSQKKMNRALKGLK